MCRLEIYSNWTEVSGSCTSMYLFTFLTWSHLFNSFFNYHMTFNHGNCCNMLVLKSLNWVAIQNRATTSSAVIDTTPCHKFICCNEVIQCCYVNRNEWWRREESETNAGNSGRYYGIRRKLLYFAAIASRFCVKLRTCGSTTTINTSALIQNSNQEWSSFQHPDLGNLLWTSI